MIISRSGQGSISGGATQVLGLDCLPEAGNAGDAVCLYAGAQAGGSSVNSLWAANFLSTALAGFSGSMWGLEIDFNDESGITSPIGFVGLDITGLGGNPTIGARIYRADSSLWQIGEVINNCETGIIVLQDAIPQSAGIVIGNTPAFAGSCFTAKQFSNASNQNVIFLLRNSDTSPAGSFIECANAANSASLFQVSAVDGSILTAGNSTVNGNSTTNGVNAVSSKNIANVSTGYVSTGLSVGWNFSSGNGEVDLLLGPGSAALGGLNIYQLNSSGDFASTTPILSLSKSGVLVSNGVIGSPLAVSSTTTSGSITATASQLAGGYLADGATQTAAFTVTTDTAANILAAMPNAAVGTSFKFRFINNDQSSTGYAGTLAGGTGVTVGTVLPNPAVPKGGYEDYLFTFTAIGATPTLSVEAVGGNSSALL